MMFLEIVQLLSVLHYAVLDISCPTLRRHYPTLRRISVSTFDFIHVLISKNYGMMILLGISVMNLHSD